jgi:aryl carrier-like protein
MSQHLENIWHKVLGVEYIADQANFFSCGGTSLSALRFVQLFRKSFPGLAFEVTDLYSMPTFKAQLAYCENLIAPRDSLSDLFDALENDSISAEEAFALFSKQIR